MCVGGSGGTILQKTLAAGEKLLVDGQSLLGYSESVSFDIKYVARLHAPFTISERAVLMTLPLSVSVSHRRIGGCCEMFCGGEVRRTQRDSKRCPRRSHSI